MTIAQESTPAGGGAGGRSRRTPPTGLVAQLTLATAPVPPTTAWPNARIRNRGAGDSNQLSQPGAACIAGHIDFSLLTQIRKARSRGLREVRKNRCITVA